MKSWACRDFAHTFPVSTKSRQAQLFITKGVTLAYGFNHAEAGRAFREAARLDPDCAMAYWGQALVLGPNINVPMSPDDEPKARELAQKAVTLKPKASPRERAYIDAVARRYSGRAEDRKARDQDYADAMRDLHRRYPDDLDAATMYAEALMDLRPWGYWMPDGRPHPGTPEAVATLEAVLQRNPRHPGAHEEPGAGGGRRRSAAEADAGGGPHGPHAFAHLPARRALRGRRRVERAGRPRRRGLCRAVPRPGHLPAGVLPPQHPFPLVGLGHGRP